MTIASQTSRITYTGDGSTTAFAVPFFFQANADIVVYLQDTVGDQTLQVLGTHYNLTGATVSTGGTCTFVTAPTTGYLISVYRDPPATQTTSYNNNDPFPAKSHELALDKLTTLAQRVKDIASRSVRQSEGEAAMTTQLAPIATRKNKMLGFGTSGELLYTSGPSFVGATVTGVATVESRATAEVTTMAASTNIIKTHGYAVFGDGGGATYKRVGASPGVGDFFQSGDGAYWERIGGSDVAVFSTVADATASFIGAQTDYVRTAGLAAAGDGGGALYKRVGGPPASGTFFQSADGAYWALTTAPASNDFATRTAAVAASISVDTTFIRTAGYVAEGDGGGARYKRVSSEPAHAGKFQSADDAWWEIAETVIDPRMLGVIIDGTTDNTTTLQNAFDVAGTLGGELRIPSTIVANGIAFTGNITISNEMTIQGVGFHSSMFLGTGSTTQGMFTVTTNNAVHFKDVWINTTTANKTAGWGIKYEGSGGTPQNSFSTVQRCQFNNHQCALDFETAAYWNVRDCIFQLFSNVGANVVVIRNSASGDAGDSQFVGNWFFGGVANTTFINWQSSGGTRIARNKFLGNGTAGVAININVQGTTGTGLISIVDNSFDGPAGLGISITTANATNILTNLTIMGNRFDGSPSSPFIYINKFAGSTIGAVNITGNNFTGPAGTGVQCAVGDTLLVNANIFGGITAAVIINSASAAIVSGNLLGGGTLTPAATSATVTIATNK